MSTLGERIRRARRAQNLTQAELAARVVCWPEQVGQWETDVRNPNYANLLRIARALNLRFDDLADDEDEEDASSKVATQYTVTLEYGREWVACEHGRDAQGQAVRMCRDCFLTLTDDAAAAGGRER